jgi:ubiquinone/menaquinone biosynthesis methyltransferase
MTQQQTTHFGFMQVPVEEKASRVRGVFDSVASRYDVMNDVMSAGLHRIWKHSMVSAIPLHANMHLLDLAGGTGDIGFRFLERCRERNLPAHITISDINAAMLAEGQKRAIDKNIICNLDWLCANAETLPLPDNSVDACTISFGIRNVTNIPKALREIHRVLKPSGKFLCLEFSPLTNHHSPITTLYDLYSFHILPRMGKAITGDSDSYQYLAESIRNFPEPETFKAMIEQAGFSRVKFETFTFGVVALHTGWKI